MSVKKPNKIIAYDGNETVIFTWEFDTMEEAVVAYPEVVDRIRTNKEHPVVDVWKVTLATVYSETII